MITEKNILDALANGQTANDLLVLIEEAKKTLEKELEIQRKKKAFAVLENAIYDYIGKDHDFWQVADVEDVAKSVVKVLEDIIAGKEESCDCGESCCCGLTGEIDAHVSKIEAKEEVPCEGTGATAKVQVITPKGKKVYNDKEAEEIINQFLATLFI